MPKVVDVEARRSQLTDAVATQIARAGMDGVTMREVARTAGWTTGAVAHYFNDKRDLLLATYRSRADLSRRRIDDARAAGGSLFDALIESALPVDAERLTNWQVFLAFMGAAVGDAELGAAHQARSESFRRLAQEAIRHEVGTGRFSLDLDVPHEARRLVALLNGVAVQAVFDPSGWDPVELRRVVDEHVASLSS